MQRGHGTTVVLPPLRPLFTRDAAGQSEDDAARHHFADVAASIRTPTSSHLSGFLHASFPSSSPVKKDNPLLPTAKVAAGGMPLLQLNSPPPAAVVSPTASLDEFEGHHHATVEDEKLRVSRERNRLHAQRTRIRKRELLENLKGRIHALQEEYDLLKQTYDFHATAACLLTLGDAADQFACVRQLDAAGDEPLEELEVDPLADLAGDVGAAGDAGMEDAEDGAHEHGCRCREEEMAVASAEERANACTCLAKDAQGKRGGAGSSLMAWSKEEREQIRRERNRLHARRARLRKKLVLERSQQVRRQLAYMLLL